MDPIFKTKDGQRVTKSQLLASGYSEERITAGLGNGVLNLIGDTDTPTQQYKTKDGQSVTTADLLGSGYSQERINAGVANGILMPDENLKKKISLGDTGGEGLPAGTENISVPQSKLDLAAAGALKAGGQIDITPIMQIDWSKEDPVGEVIKSEDEKIKKDLSKSIIDLIAQRGIPNAATDLADRKKELDKVTNSAFPTGQNANDFLTEKFSQKGVVLKPKQTSAIGELLVDHQAQPVQNLNDFDLKDIAASINPENATEIIAFNKYKKDRNIDETIKANGITEEAALNFAASQSPQVAAQLEKIKGLSKDRYDAFVGQKVLDFLYDPDVVNKVRDNPELKNQWLEQEYNLYTSYPTLAKRIVAQKISQKREDLHKGGIIVDIPTKAGIDSIVEDMMKSGEMDARDKNIYDTEIRPKIGFLKSVGRGIGNVFIPAFTNDAPIETTDLLGTLGESYKNTLRSTAHSIEDVANTLTPVPSNEKPFDNTQRLADLLQKDYSTVAIDPKSFWSEGASSTGHLTGFVLPMILGGSALGAAGLGPRAANLISQGLTFEGINKDASLKMFADNPTKQFFYTTIATGGDLMLGELLPTKEAAQGIKNSLSPEITKVVNEFTDGKITAAVAKKTLTDRAATLIKEDFPNLIKGNIKAGTAMGGFSLYHNALDAAFGGSDKSGLDIANEAIQSFKSGFLGSTPLTALGLIGENNNIKGSSVREMAFNRDYYKQVIEDNAALHPELEATKNERISNLNDAQLINKDLENNADLSEPQKQKYLLTALAQKVWQKRAEAATDERIKNDYETKAADLGKIKEAIWAGADKAPEYQSEAVIQDQKKETELKTLLGNEKSDKAIKDVNDFLQNDSFPESTPQEDKNFAKENPLQFLRTVAEQAQLTDNIEGKDVSARDGAVNRFGEPLVKLAEETFPLKEIGANEISQPVELLPADTSTGKITTVEPGEISKPVDLTIPERPEADTLLKQELLVPDENGRKINYKYEDVTFKNPFTGEQENMKAYQAKNRLTERHGLLEKLLNCLT